MNTPDFAFAANPIIVRPVDVDWGEADGETAYRVMYAGREVYRGYILPGIGLDLSEVAREYSDPYPAPASPGAWLSEVLTGEALADRVLRCESQESQAAWTVLPGGLSRQHLRKGRGVPALGRGNAFLTTRTASWIITVRETELMPLYFVSPGACCVRVVPMGAGGVDRDALDATVQKGVYALDIAACRKSLFDDYGVLASVFDLYRYDDDEPESLCARVVITPAVPAVHRCSLRFINSFGVPDRLELIGGADVSPSDDSGEDGAFDRYDSAVGAYVRCRERLPLRRVVTLHTGHIGDDTLPLLIDALCSDEVTLEGLFAAPVRVIPRLDGLQYTLREDAPRDMAVTLELVDDDDRSMPDTADGHVGVPRFFSDEFDKTFN